MPRPTQLFPRELQPLRNDTLAGHAERLRVPAYDRTALIPGIVHLGVGGFHRAHQAVYLDDLAHGGATEWGVLGVSLRRRDMKDALDPQDGLFTVVQRGPNAAEARVVGSLVGILFAPDEPDAVLEAMAHVRTRIVTLTITGGGYHLDAQTGELVEDAEIQADLATPERPRTAIGYLTEALARRRRAGIAPFTVLSCDNVPDNGPATRSAVMALASRRDPALADWIGREVAFPSSVVDRITPDASDGIDELLGAFGIADRAAVVTEPFTQWIVEDRFCNGRPPLEQVGVRFVDAVEPYEKTKKRMLNGGHSALGYVGYLLGHRDTAGAMTDPLVRAYLERLMTDEIAPLLPHAPGIDLDAYRETLLDRFANPHVGDRLSRLCGRGSTKVPAYLLPSIVAARRRGRPHELLNLAVAAWVRYLRGVDLDGNEIPVKDARFDELQPLAVAGGDDPEALMAESRVFGWLADDPMLVRSVARLLESFARTGLRSTVEAYLGGERGRMAA
jgi:mannitol 2-dehydrogenase